MRTQKQAEASRINGSKSRGPITPEGKAISSRNAITHGFLSHLLLDGENPEELDAIYLRLKAEHQPTTDTDYDMLDKMAAAWWRETRLQDIETSCVNEEIRNQIRLNPNLAESKPRDRAAKGWKACSETSRVIQMVNTYEPRLDRRYMRCLEYFKDRKREKEEEAQNCPSNEPETDLIALYSTLLPTEQSETGGSACPLPTALFVVPSQPSENSTASEISTDTASPPTSS